MFLLFIAVILLGIGYVRLSARIRKLEEGRGSLPVYASPAQATPLSPVSASPAPAPAYASRAPSWSAQFSAWLKEDWLMKLGAVLVFLGLIWFISATMLAVGENVRITAGLLIGAGLLGYGFRRIQSFVNQGSIFTVLGAGVVHLSVFVARTEYDMFPPIVALFIMLTASVFVALIAVRFRVRMLAFCGLILASLVPLLVHSSTNYVGLFSYLAIIVLGTLWVVLVTEWRDLLLGALAILSLYSIPHWSGMAHVDMDILLLFAYGFTAIFFSANIVGFLRARIITNASVVTAMWNGFFLLFWIFAGVAKEWQSLVLSFWTVVFLTTAFAVYRVSTNAKPFFSYAMVGIVFLGTATAVELSGASLAIAWTLEVGALVFLCDLLLKSPRIAGIASFLFVLPGLLVAQRIASYPIYGSRSYWVVSGQDTALFNEHFFAILLFALVLFGLGVYMRMRGSSEGEWQKLPDVLTATGSAFGLILLWVFLHHALSDGIATTITLALYTALGIALYFAGRHRESRHLKLSGEVLLGCVVLHLFFVDIWNMDVAIRVIAFPLIGAILMATAFMAKKSRSAVL